MEAGSSRGNSNAQGMGQSGREAEGTRASQQVSAAEPSWLREMRARYDQHDATPAGIVSRKKSLATSGTRLREISVVINTQRVSPCKKVAAVRIKQNRKDNESGPESRGKKRKPGARWVRVALSCWKERKGRTGARQVILFGYKRYAFRPPPRGPKACAYQSAYICQVGDTAETK